MSKRFRSSRRTSLSFSLSLSSGVSARSPRSSNAVAESAFDALTRVDDWRLKLLFESPFFNLSSDSLSSYTSLTRKIRPTCIAQGHRTPEWKVRVGPPRVRTSRTELSPNSCVCSESQVSPRTASLSANGSSPSSSDPSLRSSVVTRSNSCPLTDTLSPLPRPVVTTFLLSI
jgi:hypothetical protein